MVFLGRARSERGQTGPTSFRKVLDINWLQTATHQVVAAIGLLNLAAKRASLPGRAVADTWFFLREQETERPLM